MRNIGFVEIVLDIRLMEPDLDEQGRLEDDYIWLLQIWEINK